MWLLHSRLFPPLDLVLGQEAIVVSHQRTTLVRYITLTNNVATNTSSTDSHLTVPVFSNL